MPPANRARRAAIKRGPLDLARRRPRRPSPRPSGRSRPSWRDRLAANLDQLVAQGEHERPGAASARRAWRGCWPRGCARCGCVMWSRSAIAWLSSPSASACRTSRSRASGCSIARRSSRSLLAPAAGEAEQVDDVVHGTAASRPPAAAERRITTSSSSAVLSSAPAAPLSTARAMSRPVEAGAQHERLSARVDGTELLDEVGPIAVRQPQVDHGDVHPGEQGRAPPPTLRPGRRRSKSGSRSNIAASAWRTAAWSSTSRTRTSRRRRVVGRSAHRPGGRVVPIPGCSG